MSGQPAAVLLTSSISVSRRQRIIAVAALAALLCSGLTSCTKTQVGLSAVAIAAVIIGTTVGVRLAVQHSHHTLQGCVSSGIDGLELRLSDAKIYALKGELANIKVGDKLSLHGSKSRMVQPGSGANQVFVVEKVNKNFGPCLARLTASPAQGR